jgi:hypothetical protein
MFAAEVLLEMITGTSQPFFVARAAAADTEHDSSDLGPTGQ